MKFVLIAAYVHVKFFGLLPGGLSVTIGPEFYDEKECKVWAEQQEKELTEEGKKYITSICYKVRFEGE